MVNRFCCSTGSSSSERWRGSGRRRPRLPRRPLNRPRPHSRQPDSLLNGILIGAGVGAIPGIYWLIADPNQCTGLCAKDYAAIASGRWSAG